MSKKPRKVSVATAEEFQNQTMWDVPSELFERWLDTLPNQMQIEKFKAAGKVIEKDKDAKVALEKRLKAFRTPVTPKTMKRFVG